MAAHALYSVPTIHIPYFIVLQMISDHYFKQHHHHQQQNLCINNEKTSYNTLFRIVSKTRKDFAASSLVSTT